MSQENKTEPQSHQASPVYRWYYAPDLPGLFAVIAVLVTASVIIGIRASNFGSDLQKKFIRPANFALRAKMSREPVLDPRIQIYTFDEASFQAVRDYDLSPADWGRILQGLAPESPQAVLIDSDFSHMKDLPGMDALAKTIKQLPYPVIAGVTATSGTVDPELEYHPTATAYQLLELLRTGKPGFPDQFDSVKDLPHRPAKLIGPPSPLREAFAGLGTLEVFDDGYLPLFHRLDREHVVPSAPLFLAKKRGLADGKLTLDGKPVVSRADFSQLVDWNQPATYRTRTRSLIDLAKRIRGRESLELPKEAIVVLMPRVFPGRDRYLDTPVGNIPRGYGLVAAINGMLSGKTMSVMPYAFSLVMICAMIGGLLAYFLPPVAFYPSMFLGAVWIVAAGTWAFANKGIEIPWVWSTLSFLACSYPLYHWRRTRGLERRAMLREALNGVLPPGRVGAVVNSQARFHPEPTGAVVSMMFIDVAGFAAAAELLTPDRTFGALRTTMRWLTDTVHGYGGVVANLTGEGMLAFFGYPCDGTKPLSQHADQALSCAIAIQKESLRQSVENRKSNEPVFPLRIGINTGAAYIGDLAARDRMDLTLIGGAVSHAKLLENSCDPYCILLGATTRDMLVKLDSTELTLKRRYVSVKHSTELVEAYECDPVQDQPDLRNQAIAAHRDFVKVARKEMRWNLPHGYSVEVSGNQGSGFLHNFSESGLAVKFDRFLGVGVTMNLNVDVDNGQLRARLMQQGLLPLVCEVRWGRALGGGRYLLGLQIRNLTREQRELLLSELRGAFIDAMPNAVAA